MQQQYLSGKLILIFMIFFVVIAQSKLWSLRSEISKFLFNRERTMRSGPKNHFLVVVVLVLVLVLVLGFLSPKTLIGRFWSRDEFITTFWALIGSMDYKNP